MAKQMLPNLTLKDKMGIRSPNYLLLKAMAKAGQCQFVKDDVCLNRLAVVEVRFTSVQDKLYYDKKTWEIEREAIARATTSLDIIAFRSDRAHTSGQKACDCVRRNYDG